MIHSADSPVVPEFGGGSIGTVPALVVLWTPNDAARWRRHRSLGVQ
jgi:hypothetical protein